MERKTIVINFYAGPGAGKSTFAAATFAQLKWRDINCELVTEYAKDKVWEKSTHMLNNQFYVFGKQQHRLFRLKGQVDVIITDAPLLNSIIYDAVDDKTFRKLIVEEYNRYENINIFLHRKKKYNPKGRYQTEDEAKELDVKIFNVLNTVDSGNYIEVDGLPENIENVVIPLILKKINEEESKPKFMLSWTSWKNTSYLEKYKYWIENILGGVLVNKASEADMLIVPGGVDIGKDLGRDDIEQSRINDFIHLDKPIFGICRGLQLLGTMEGCELIQHIPDNVNIIEHRSSDNNFEGQSSYHYVTHSDVQNPLFEVNSRHHQGFKFPASLNSDDGIVEAMSPVDVAKHLGRQGNLQYLKYFAVQWHPERIEMYNNASQQYIKLRMNDLLPENKKLKIH